MFYNDKEKMYDFKILSKDEFLKSYSYLTEEEYNTVKLICDYEDKIKNIESKKDMVLLVREMFKDDELDDIDFHDLVEIDIVKRLEQLGVNFNILEELEMGVYEYILRELYWCEMENMTVELIGLNRYLYTFETKEMYDHWKEKMESKGKIEEVFINNGYGFEIKLNKEMNL